MYQDSKVLQQTLPATESRRHLDLSTYRMSPLEKELLHHGKKKHVMAAMHTG
jgi:hypothetical protein